MKTFLKDFRVMITALAIVLIAAYLGRIDLFWVEIGLTFALPFGVMILVLEDFYRKRDEDKARPQGVARKANLEYVGGMFLMGGVLISWFWSSQGQTFGEMYLRLALTFFLVCMGAAWFGLLYPVSRKSKKEVERDKWAAIRPTVLKYVKTDPQKAEKLLHRRLKYALVGNSLDGDADVSRPIALYAGKPTTFAKVAKLPNEDGRITDLLANYSNYIKALVYGPDADTEKV